MKIIFGADLVPNKEKNEHLFIAGDARALFGDALDIIKSADRFIINLECALTYRGEPIPKCGPNFRRDPRIVNGLVASGVTDVVLANNHLFDYGTIGYRDTLAALDSVGLPYTGVGENDQDSRKIYYIDLGDGKKLGIVNVTEHEYSYALPDRCGCNPFDPYLTMQDIREAKKNADYVTVIYHGGKEYCHYPSPRVYNMTHEMVHNGADVVLLQHSHCIGTYEEYQGAHIVYGQGNVHFVTKNKNFHKVWFTALLVEVDFVGEHPSIKFYPIEELEDTVDLAKGERAKEIMDEFWAHSESLKDGTWYDCWRDFCFNSPYNYNYLSAFDQFTHPDAENDPQLKERVKHYLNTEIHHDVLRELLKTYNWTNK